MRDDIIDSFEQEFKITANYQVFWKQADAGEFEIRPGINELYKTDLSNIDSAWKNGDFETASEILSNFKSTIDTYDIPRLKD